MKTFINLMPIETIRWLERQRQLRSWIAILLTATAILSASTGVVIQKQRQFSRRVDLALASVAHIRKASDELARLTENLDKIQQLDRNYRAVERRDVPLALLQTIVHSCRGIQNTLQIGAIKFSEVQEIQPDAFTPLQDPRNSAGQGIRANSLQVFLHGQASPEDCGRLLAALRESQLFSEVDLMAAQAVNDQQQSRQTFQIRCHMGPWCGYPRSTSRDDR